MSRMTINDMIIKLETNNTIDRRSSDSIVNSLKLLNTLSDKISDYVLPSDNIMIKNNNVYIKLDHVIDLIESNIHIIENN